MLNSLQVKSKSSKNDDDDEDDRRILKTKMAATADSSDEKIKSRKGQVEIQVSKFILQESLKIKTYGQKPTYSKIFLFYFDNRPNGHVFKMCRFQSQFSISKTNKIFFSFFLLRTLM